MKLEMKMRLCDIVLFIVLYSNIIMANYFLKKDLLMRNTIDSLALGFFFREVRPFDFMLFSFISTIFNLLFSDI